MRPGNRQLCRHGIAAADQRQLRRRRVLVARAAALFRRACDGGQLLGARMAYETWGTLDAARSNAVTASRIRSSV